jgi:F420H(2)-dependent quinone reductase
MPERGTRPVLGDRRHPPSVRLAPPPPMLMRMVNPVVRRILATPRLAARIDKLMLLEFTGRRTGTRIQVPVVGHRVDGALTIVTGRPWRWNFTAGAPVTVTHRGRVRHGRAYLIPASPDQVGTTLRALLNAGTSPFLLGLRFARGSQPTTADLGRVGAALIRLDLQSPDQTPTGGADV